MSDDVRKLIIIGGGPAGYTAALYAARADLDPLVIEGFNWGGQLMITSDVENYPGFVEGVMGPELMSHFRSQAERFGAEFITDDVTRVDVSEQPFRVWIGDEEFRAESIVVATGASARQIGLPSEQQLQGKGVTYCAVCDGAFYRGKGRDRRRRRRLRDGGGDLPDEVREQGHRRPPADELRASAIMVDRARENEKIEFVLNAVVEEVLAGENGTMRGVRVRDTQTGETSELEASGLFVAIGHDPNTKLFLDQLEHDAAGYLITQPDTTETNVPGVFAAGDVRITSTGRRSRPRALAPWPRSTRSGISRHGKAIPERH